LSEILVKTGEFLLSYCCWFWRSFLPASAR